HGLEITLDHFETRKQQERALNILQFKLDVLWSMADSISLAYEFNRKPFGAVTDENISHKGFM
ncbi:MAG: pyrroloquinoline quinone biosynthesis protein C, partial [Glaciecola sp.]